MAHLSYLLSKPLVNVHLLPEFRQNCVTILRNILLKRIGYFAIHKEAYGTYGSVWAAITISIGLAIRELKSIPGKPYSCARKKPRQVCIRSGLGNVSRLKAS